MYIHQMKLNGISNMTEKVKKYRAKHKRCKYCKHLRLLSRYGNPGSDYYWCVAKDKIVGDYCPDMTEVSRCFCQCYEVKDDE